MKIGINGLGRIGRCLIRAIYENELLYKQKIELSALNGSTSSETHAHLIQYDSVHGRFPYNVESEEGYIIINDQKIPLSMEKEPKSIFWEKHNVDIVLECTGKFNKKSLAEQHINSTVKKVLVSSPMQDSDITIVYGVNNEMLKKEHNIISAGSCTTNCIAPILKIMNDTIGIKSGFITTIHSYTNDQNLVDNNHKDLRRARACMMSIIPTTTGATRTIDLIIPELKGKLNGTAVRVPTPNVSMVNLVFNSIKSTTANEINDIIKNLSQNSKVINITDKKLVSIDFCHSTYSSIVDANETYVTNNNLCRIAAWYDNEWAFAMRMLDIVSLLSESYI
ncbi:MULTISPECIES: type I glyceraldehyde-3-phosphate dehydrogenase [Ehrlichia]|uniref:Glyceraldehyde-3-phosphate dehydrogenase, type I n=1 Tax=Ehrlichia cf. muris str. EmCRT TaxID=1359167 RepID=A0A0F3N609_9RICK|nr:MULTISPECIES: type I glyceraldehyde-3-phosphate dehydrogenase [Ehrlichia]KJV63515.1 glyceraldehyde-3-phosphate dehydrogenase, type I [Ehrlichia cf. muris str. EmCRT]OUC04182.1 glyceraldehyde-3-phosphate dehydrogenase [Ehrlichia sp. Wisconsin_h]